MGLFFITNVRAAKTIACNATDILIDLSIYSSTLFIFQKLNFVVAFISHAKLTYHWNGNDFFYVKIAEKFRSYLTFPVETTYVSTSSLFFFAYSRRNRKIWVFMMFALSICLDPARQLLNARRGWTSILRAKLNFSIRSLIHVGGCLRRSLKQLDLFKECFSIWNNQATKMEMKTSQREAKRKIL